MPFDCVAVDPDPTLDHYNYDYLDENCSCSLCSEYKRAKEELEEAEAGAVGEGWKSMKPKAKRRRDAHLHMLAISNQRDLYCEMSFLTQNKRDSADILAWLLIKLRSKKNSWWANHSAKKTLSAWIVEWATERDLTTAGTRK
jgi:hypothetical protein